jgi:hypothetical protein
VKAGDLLYYGPAAAEEGAGWRELARKAMKRLAQGMLGLVKGRQVAVAEPPAPVDGAPASVDVAASGPSSAQIAAEHYRRAANMQVPHAYAALPDITGGQAALTLSFLSRRYFNLGFLHLRGIGVAQDYPLAKRFFDLAATTSADAKVAVDLALFSMTVQERWDRLKEWWLEPPKPEPTIELKAEPKPVHEVPRKRGAPVTTDDLKVKPAPTKKKVKGKGKPKERVRYARSYSDLLVKHLLDLETALAVACAMLAAVLFRYRAFVFDAEQARYLEQEGMRGEF